MGSSLMSFENPINFSSDSENFFVKNCLSGEKLVCTSDVTLMVSGLFYTMSIQFLL